MYEKTGLRESLTITVTDKDGNVIATRSPHNPSLLCRLKAWLGLVSYCDDIVLDSGLADVADMISDRYSYMQFGNGTTTPAHDNTGLESALFTRVACSKSIATTFYTNDTARFTATLTPTYDANISEAILCTADTGGVIFARETFPTVEVKNGVSITATWDVVVMR